VDGADLGEGLVRNGLALDWQQYAKGSTTQLNVPLSMSVEGYGKADVEPWLYRVHVRASGTLANCSDVNAHPCDASMCNLYSITTIIALFRAMNRYVGNDPPMPGVFRSTPYNGHRPAARDHCPDEAGSVIEEGRHARTGTTGAAFRRVHPSHRCWRIYTMRRFVLGWKKLGLEQRLGSRIVTTL
jgi:hypothetical protein